MAARPGPEHHSRYWDWTENVAGGCVPADTTCRNCYAVVYARGIHAANDVQLYRGTTKPTREGHTWSGLFTKRPPDHPAWTSPLRYGGPEIPLLGPGKPPILWVNSMADLFVPGRPFEDFDRFLDNVAISPHIGLVLTKYPEGLVKYFSAKPRWWRKWFWLVFSAGTQETFDERWPVMRPMAEDGWTVGASIQPMVEKMMLPPDAVRLLRWVICGGEQSPGKRPMDPDDARSLREQCKGANPPIPFYCKQMTRGYRPLNLLFQELPAWP
jgi:protein gp37